MILFINPLNSFLTKSSKTAKLVYWGVQLIPAAAENKSLQVSGLYYSKLLNYIKHYIDSAIEEIEQQTQTKPETIETEDEDIENWPIPESEPISLKDRMLACECKQELESFKAEIGAHKAIELWESLDILEKNHIKSINLSPSPDKAPTPMGYLLQYTDDNKNQHKARLIGHYLNREPLKDNERSILILGELKPIAAPKSSLKPYTAKDQKPLYEGELEKLQQFLTTPQPQQEDEPDATALSALQFTGLAGIPKKPQNGSVTGKQPDSEQSKASVGVQPKLNLKAIESVPETKAEAVPTPLLEAVAEKIRKVNPELSLSYDTNGKSTFLEIFHGSSNIGLFEDDGVELWTSKTAKMLHHGFTEEMIDALSEVKLSPKA